MKTKRWPCSPPTTTLKTRSELLQAVKNGDEFLNEHPEYLITFGIKPTAPETGYGYIKKDGQLGKVGDTEILKADRFVEKPNYETALEYMDSGEFLWNSGMFLWKTNTIIEKFKTYAPDTYERLEKIREVVGTGKFDGVFKKEFPEMDKNSIDYAVLENETGHGSGSTGHQLE